MFILIARLDLDRDAPHDGRLAGADRDLDIINDDDDRIATWRHGELGRSGLESHAAALYQIDTRFRTILGNERDLHESGGRFDRCASARRDQCVALVKSDPRATAAQGNDRSKRCRRGRE